MISKPNATSQQCIILSKNDSRISELKYKAGQKFILKLDDTFDKNILKLIDDREVIVSIRGYAVTVSGQIVYDIQIIEPSDQDLDFHWLVTKKDLEEFGHFLSDGSTRFVMLDV